MRAARLCLAANTLQCNHEKLVMVNCQVLPLQKSGQSQTGSARHLNIDGFFAGIPSLKSSSSKSCMNDWILSLILPSYLSSSSCPFAGAAPSKCSPGQNKVLSLHVNTPYLYRNTPVPGPQFACNFLGCGITYGALTASLHCYFYRSNRTEKRSLLSSASPVYEIKAEGIQSVIPRPFFLKKARAGHIPCSISPGLKCGPYSAAGET